MQDYTVVETKILEGIETYILSELGDEYGYQTEHFAPLTGLDETALVNEEWEEKVCVPA